MNRVLSEAYSADEIKTTLFHMCPDKSPDRTNFQLYFFRSIGMYAEMRFLRVLDGIEDTECINNTHVVLIPKVYKSG